MASRPAARRLLTIFIISFHASGPGCDRPPAVSASVLVADSKRGSEIRRLTLPAGTAARAFPVAARVGDLARGPGGQVYLASGREILLLPASGDPLPLLQVEQRIDTVLPSADGTRLYILEHPPAVDASRAGKGEGPAAVEEAADERVAPHRLRLWDLAGARLQGEIELDPLAYEICEGPALVLATHLKGRRIEIARLGPGGFAAGAAEVVELSDPAAGPLNRQALIRAAAVAPGGGFALLVENGVGGEQDRGRLWTLQLSGGRLAFHPLSARGIFQDGIAFLSPGDGGAFRAVLNGRDRMVLVTGGPAEGFREGAVVSFPGHFFDPRRVFLPAAAGSSASGRELVLLAGSDVARERGLLAAVDPLAARVVWVWDLAAPADLLVVE